MMKRQKGAAMVEFAIVALLFFSLLFGAIETGRWMFTWNTLVEATRRGARIAAVCPLGDPYIKVAAVFGNTALPDAPQNSPILNGLDTTDVSITYYKITDVITGGVTTGGKLDPVPLTASATEKGKIQLVEVTITYNHRFLAPVIGDILGVINAPTFRTLIPVESLGSLQDGTPNPNLCY